MPFDKTLVGLGSLLLALSLSGPLRAEGAPMDGPTYTVRLRDLAERIDELKEKIRRQHARVSLLGDSIFGGGVGVDSRVSVRFTSELSRAFRVARVLVLLDGAVQVNRTDPVGDQTGPFEIPAFDGMVPSGPHTVQVQVDLQGDGFGVFSYLRGYRFQVRSTHSFTAIEGRSVDIAAVSYESGTTITPFEERPALRYKEKIGAGPDAEPR